MGSLANTSLGVVQVSTECDAHLSYDTKATIEKVCLHLTLSSMVQVLRSTRYEDSSDPLLPCAGPQDC